MKAGEKWDIIPHIENYYKLKRDVDSLIKNGHHEVL